MPVSRKRKKSGKSKGANRAPGKRSPRQTAAPGPPDLLASMAANRRRLAAHRESLAAAAAEDLVAELVMQAPGRSDSELEDDLCARLGPPLHAWQERSVEDQVHPEMFAEAVGAAAVTALRTALDDAATASDRWQAPWRVLTTAARILPERDTLAEAIEQLRGHPGGRVLPPTPDSPEVTGQVLWTRDAYGSRFGVTAAFGASDGTDRWYLWDIDACGFQVVTVHSGFYATCEQALAEWLAGVGQEAAGGAALTPVDDASLLGDIMPAPEGFLRIGGESVEQFAEYHRSRSLAEAALAAVEKAAPRTSTAGTGLNAETATAEFAAWLRANRTDLPEEVDELAGELAGSWSLDASSGALYGTCSPHRVAQTVVHMRDYYLDDFAAELVALLPDWTTWLTERAGAAGWLAERCLPYARGEPHPEVGADRQRSYHLARVIE